MIGLGNEKEQSLPDHPFAHASGCRIFEVDPAVELHWIEVEPRYFARICVCSTEYYSLPVVDTRVRLDPLDPKTSRHLGQCEYAAVTDPDVLRYILRVTANDGHSFVECGACMAGWQVADFTEGSGR